MEIEKKTNRCPICLLLFAFLASCTVSNRQIAPEETEDKEVKEMLQGLWMDEITESPLLQIKGDTIYYTNPAASPVAFKVVGDSLKTYGVQTTGYYMERRSRQTLWLQSSIGGSIHLYKAEDAIDSLTFVQKKETQHPERNVIQKDHVVHYNNVRYRGYVYINPSNIKVVQPSLSEDGFQVDNVYYDNIIHICVYEGKKCLFSKDIRKDDFAGTIPDDFLQWAVLSDMDFIGVNAEGYQYQATVCIPNGASCYLVNLSVSTDGRIDYEVEQ